MIKFFRDLKKIYLEDKILFITISYFVLFFVFSFIMPHFMNENLKSIDLYMISSPPSKFHILGTDELGRDILYRLMIGGRISFIIGFLVMIIQILIGVTLGVVSGYYGGIVDILIVKLCELIMSFPIFILIVSLSLVFNGGVISIILILSFVSFTSLTRIIRGQVIRLKNLEFIVASKTLGASDFRIIKNHIIPHIFYYIKIYSNRAFANAILSESSLSFLGMGVVEPQTSLGSMIASAKNMNVIKYEWWTFVFPGMMIFLTVMMGIFMGSSKKFTQKNSYF
ncbi:MAG: ABC transporter permease [Peptostreptococcaceae bacterium]|jgi:peptide/nickel transport system permease protein|nr:ABC transporter permease [Peptostreptococcaceae bacterium]